MDKKILNIGCGNDKMEEAINADLSPLCNPDICFDLTKGIPYPKDYFDEVILFNVLTQIQSSKEFSFVMNELWRVTKHTGLVKIRVPLAPYENAFRDPMDVRYFTKNSFEYFVSHTRRYDNYGKTYGFKPWKKVSQNIEIKNDFNEVWGSMLIELRPKGRAKQKQPFAGHKHSEATKRKMSLLLKGDKSPTWKGGKTAEKDLIRNSGAYRSWRTAVFQRDNYTCTTCGARSGNGETVYLNADHIQPFSKFPELRLELSNGRTLCVPCHKKTDTYGYKINKTK